MKKSDFQDQLRLRARALAHLEDGTAPPTCGGAVSADALSLLHQLANDPACAGDVLKILRELQIFQVELDIQHEQMERRTRELTGALNRYAVRYAHAPFGYFVVDPDCVVIDANFAAAECLGIERDALTARKIDSLFTPESRPPLLALLADLRLRAARGGSFKASGMVQAGTRHFHAVGSIAPESGCFLLALIDSSDGQTRPSLFRTGDHVHDSGR